MLALDGLSLPNLLMPAQACDAHMHVFGPASYYPHVAHPHYTLPDGKLTHYLDLMKLLQLQRFVIVQPSFYGTDNRCLLDALAHVGEMARGVVMIEESISDRELALYHSLGVRAVRLDLFSRSGWALQDIQDYILRMAKRIAPLGWHLQFYTPGWLVKNLIPFLDGFDHTHVIDHMGYMLEEDGLTMSDFERLLGILKHGRCWLKLSAPYRIARKRGYEAVLPMAKAIIETAPANVVWGSDWPHIPESGRDTGGLLNLLTAWTTDPVLHRLILSDNPARLFDFKR